MLIYDKMFCLALGTGCPWRAFIPTEERMKNAGEKVYEVENLRELVLKLRGLGPIPGIERPSWAPDDSEFMKRVRGRCSSGRGTIRVIHPRALN